MKNLLLASVGVLALGVGSAAAADMPRRAAMPVKAPAYVSQMYNWNGVYIGINGGGAFSGSNSSSGGLIGGTLGVNMQSGGPLVWGLEADLDWTRIRGSTALNETSNRWLGTARGRLGYAMGETGSVMPYITGGLAFGDINNAVTGFGSSRNTKAGYALGGGIEAALTSAWTAKVEYLYVDLGSGPTVGAVPSDFHTNIVRAGLNYRF
ncbi:MAG TPA: outer membrane beta-barrel protein [Rhizomicrobium sp.]